jgi:hypothetical protein
MEERGQRAEAPLLTDGMSSARHIEFELPITALPLHEDCSRPVIVIVACKN